MITKIIKKEKQKEAREKKFLKKEKDASNKRAASRDSQKAFSKKEKYASSGKATPADSIFGVSGVYFLYRDKEVIYIGESYCVVSRIGAHFKEGVKGFDSFRYIEVMGGEKARKITEKHLIRKYKPLLNVTHKNRL